MAASARGHVAVVHALIEAHAGVNQHPSYGKAAINLARRRGHEEVVQLLLQSGAQVRMYMQM